MLEIQMQPVDVDNLLVFLGRVQLTGKEVAAYTQIIQALYAARERKEPVETLPEIEKIEKAGE